MIKKALLAAGLTAAALSPVAQANDDPADTRLYLSPLYNFYNTDVENYAERGATGWAVKIGKHLNHWLAIEAGFDTIEVEFFDGSKAEADTISLSALAYPFGREYGMYTTLGIGQAEADGFEDENVVDLGFGFMRAIGKNGLQLRGEAKARRFTDSETTDHIASLGFLKPFGDNQGSTYDFPSWDGEQDKRPYINLSGNYIVGNQAYTIDGGDYVGGDNFEFGLRAGVGTYISRSLSFELHYDQSKRDLISDVTSPTPAAGGNKVEFESYGIDALIFKRRNPEFAPYTVLGLGLTDITANGGYQADGNFFDVGFGFLSSFTDYRFGIRFDARYRVHDIGGEINSIQDGIINLGIQIPLGAAPTPPDEDGDGVADKNDRCPNTPAGAPVDEDGCPLDSDNDGVIDPQDACPDTPEGTEVDARGCPVDKDSDGDGVNDSKDECPGTPEGTEVDSKGCPIDDDGDGVINSADECPDTPEGMEVNGKGCVEDQVIVLEGVNFEFDSANLTPNAKRILDDTAKVWDSQPDLSALVAGHTDWMGPDDYNLQLSQQRADSVKAYLVSKGIPADQLQARGFGESQPIDDNETDEGRAKNRRVELQVD